MYISTDEGTPRARGAVRVLVADDHQIVRQAVRKLLETERQVVVVGEAADGRQAVALSGELAPDVVLMDVAMPGLNGIEATRQIVRRSPTPRVVALSVHDDPRTVRACISAGATAFVPKTCGLEELTRAIQSAGAGKPYANAAMTSAGAEPPAAASAAGVLSPRAREVLQLLAEGWATKEIAAELDVSVKTVETHRRQVAEKLGLNSVAELTKFAIREGLTTL
jgi:DNA-binding NarL/FixJ family response regulator